MRGKNLSRKSDDAGRQHRRSAIGVRSRTHQRDVQTSVRRLLVLVFGILIAIGKPAKGEPMVSTLDAIVKASSTVVIAKFVAPANALAATGYDLDVDRTIVGSVSSATIHV